MAGIARSIGRLPVYSVEKLRSRILLENAKALESL
jgi:hypothetical protein